MNLAPHIWPETARIAPSGTLEVGGCDLAMLAERFGTPLYVIDENTIRTHCRAYKAALATYYLGKSSVHYACKSLLNTAIAEIVLSEGLHLDVVSGGELYIALRSGAAPAQIHLHGNAKPENELEFALRTGIGRIVVDNLDELERLAAMTARQAVIQRILLRISPGVAAATHAHIQTGRADSKFGIPVHLLERAAEIVKGARGLQLSGLHFHLGSQLFHTEPYQQAIDIALDCAKQMSRNGIEMEELSPGGGAGVAYLSGEQAIDIAHLVKTISQSLIEGCSNRGMKLPQLVLEPGRSISARAGVALYRVIATKPLERITAEDVATRYLHVDGGMGDNMRPSLYGAQYTIAVANRMNEEPGETVHVAGRYCESGDVLARNVLLQRAAVGDLVAMATAGAYTLCMASNYNCTLRPAVVLVRDGGVRLIQSRESYEDLVARDFGLTDP